MPQDGASHSATTVVPLFPLPNVVLLPRAVLPLHLFEERYKLMMAYALHGDRRIAMAILKPGWEKNYYGKAPIEPVVCVGEILTHELLDEGKYNFLLRGEFRARMIREIAGHDFRLAEVELMQEIHPAPDSLGDERDYVISLLARPEMARLPGIEQFREFADGLLPMPDLADLLAFHLLDDLQIKQKLLSEPDVRQRVRITLAGLELLRATLPAPRPRTPRDPSMN